MFARKSPIRSNCSSKPRGVPEENISLLSFRNGKPVELCSGNCRTSQIEDALPATKGAGLTPLYDSIVFASQRLSEHADAQTQKALILFSDGQDTISLKSLRDALDSTVTHNIQIYSIDMNNSTGYEPGRQVYYAPFLQRAEAVFSG